MRSALLDRLLLIGTGAALVLWVACLLIGWARALDSSGVSTLLALAATLTAVAVSMRLPGQLVRAAQRILLWLDVRGAAGVEVATPRRALASLEAGRGATRLMAAMVAVSAIGGLLSTAAVWAGAAMMDAWAYKLLWSNANWAVVRFVFPFVGMMPIALGISLVFLVGATFRSGGSRDLYAPLCRDWLWSVAIASGAMAYLWNAGVNLTAVSLLMPLVLTVVAIVLAGRKKVTCLLRPLVRPIAHSSQILRRATIVLCHAAAAIVMVLQMRFLRDAGDLSTARVAAWVGFSAMLLAIFFRRTDRRQRPHGKVSASVAVVGVSTAVMAQFALAVACIRSDLDGGPASASAICLAAFCALQIPIAALAAAVLARQRRLFAVDGGRARSYASCATGGLAAGLAAMLLITCSGGAGLVLVGMGLAVLTIGLVVAISSVSDNAATHLKWAICAAGLMCSLAGANLIAASDAKGSINVGAQLTSTRAEQCKIGDGRCGLLPNPPARSAAVDAALNGVVARLDPMRRWWTINQCPCDIPTLLAADTTGRRSSVLSAAFGGEYPQTVRVGFGRTDSIILAAGPVDHPCGWRMYAQSCLISAVRRLNPDGRLIIRTQASAGRVGWIVALAETVRQLGRQGWLAAARTPTGWDVFIVAHQSPPVATRANEPYMVGLARIHNRWPQVRPLRIMHPMSPSTRSISDEEFEQFLREAAVYLPTSLPASAAR